MAKTEKKRVYIEGGGQHYAMLFDGRGYEPKYILDKDVDLVLFTGGEDVTPGLYGDKAHHSTQNNTVRDARCSEIFSKAKGMGLPMVGICRGAQFLNVMCGGRMYQDVSNHCASHWVEDSSGLKYLVTSTHHQMMMPSDKAEIIATAIDVFSDRLWYEGEEEKRDTTSKNHAEIVYYAEQNALCCQGHPEMNRFSPEYALFRDMFFQYINTKLGV